MTMLATREFGPKGIGWGVEIQEERFDNGAPITRKVKGSDGNETWEIILMVAAVTSLKFITSSRSNSGI
jgi:hypothetical protein